MDRYVAADERMKRGPVEPDEAGVGGEPPAHERRCAEHADERVEAERTRGEEDDGGDEEGEARRVRADQQAGDECAQDEVARVAAGSRSNAHECRRVRRSGWRRQVPQTVTWSRRVAIRFSPMPGMRSSSFTDPKPPCCWR